MSRYCPKCGYGDSSREHHINGRTCCNACGYINTKIEWYKEQSEAELNVGISSRLRGNPLEIEKRYFAMEKKIIELETEVTGLAFTNLELNNHIDSLEWVINDNTDTMNTLRLIHAEEKHRNEVLELEIEDLKRQILEECK